MELSTQQAKPGDDLKISVSTKPNSYVGLLGVDQSVLLLKKGNDLEKSEVFEQLEGYNTRNYYRRRYWGPYHNTYDDFDRAGAAVLTNAKEEQSEFNPNYKLLCPFRKLFKYFYKTIKIRRILTRSI